MSGSIHSSSEGTFPTAKVDAIRNSHRVPKSDALQSDYDDDSNSQIERMERAYAGREKRTEENKKGKGGKKKWSRGEKKEGKHRKHHKKRSRKHQAEETSAKKADKANDDQSKPPTTHRSNMPHQINPRPDEIHTALKPSAGHQKPAVNTDKHQVSSRNNTRTDQSKSRAKHRPSPVQVISDALKGRVMHMSKSSRKHGGDVKITVDHNAIDNNNSSGRKSKQNRTENQAGKSENDASSKQRGEMNASKSAKIDPPSGKTCEESLNSRKPTPPAEKERKQNHKDRRRKHKTRKEHSSRRTNDRAPSSVGHHGQSGSRKAEDNSAKSSNSEKSFTDGKNGGKVGTEQMNKTGSSESDRKREIKGRSRRSRHSARKHRRAKSDAVKESKSTLADSQKSVHKNKRISKNYSKPADQSSRVPKDSSKSTDQSSRVPKHSPNSRSRSSKVPKHSSKSKHHSSRVPKYSPKSADQSSKVPKDSSKSTDQSSRVPKHSPNSRSRSSKVPKHSSKSKHHSSRVPKYSTKSADRSSKVPKHSAKSTDHSEYSSKTTEASSRDHNNSPQSTNHSSKISKHSSKSTERSKIISKSPSSDGTSNPRVHSTSLSAGSERHPPELSTTNHIVMGRKSNRKSRKQTPSSTSYTTIRARPSPQPQPCSYTSQRESATTLVHSHHSAADEYSKESKRQPGDNTKRDRRLGQEDSGKEENEERKHHKRRHHKRHLAQNAVKDKRSATEAKENRRRDMSKNYERNRECVPKSNSRVEKGLKDTTDIENYRETPTDVIKTARGGCNNGDGSAFVSSRSQKLPLDSEELVKIHNALSRRNALDRSKEGAFKWFVRKNGIVKEDVKMLSRMLLSAIGDLQMTHEMVLMTNRCLLKSGVVNEKRYKRDLEKLERKDRRSPVVLSLFARQLQRATQHDGTRQREMQSQ